MTSRTGLGDDAPLDPWRSRGGRALVLVGLVLLAFNLRPAAVSVGPVLSEIRSALGMSSTVAGVLTALPVVSFAAFGALAPRVAAKVGPHRTTLVALVAVCAGIVLRSRVDSTVGFLLLSLLALAGMATGNVVMPSLVRLHFRRHVGLVTATYSTALAVGLTTASLTTAPIATAYDDWRAGILTWGLTAAVAAVPWVLLALRETPATPEPTQTPQAGASYTLRQVAGTRLGRRMAMFFGFQSLMAYSIYGWFAEIYRDAGFSRDEAGVLLGVIAGISIPLSFLLPVLAARLENLRPMVWTVVLCYPVGYLGLAFAPAPLAYLWAVLVGIGASTFPLVLAMIALRARTPGGTAALSGFTQSAGYVIAVVGPFGMGVLHDLTGSWSVGLVVLTVLVAPLLWAALQVAPQQYVEDELA
ncbi:putative MFS transporter [Marmoricola endophyticus]|uniref:MFS transporter n=1 Tax=Marmoricola endophyticus TaxID=2040280 RepID=A0A917F8P6_9ACTN|nr:MFS transporter [Marmoricola endophyticus]GGF58233.1 putative MFS transporter [Marmoricola endophyticus]